MIEVELLILLNDRIINLGFCRAVLLRRGASIVIIIICVVILLILFKLYVVWTYILIFTALFLLFLLRLRLFLLLLLSTWILLFLFLFRSWTCLSVAIERLIAHSLYNIHETIDQVLDEHSTHYCLRVWHWGSYNHYFSQGWL